MQYYNIAGLTVKFNSSGRITEQAAPYKCEPREPVDIEISDSRIEEVFAYWKDKYPDQDEDLKMYMATGGIFYLELLAYDGLMLHSSAVVVDGKAYLFTANSGTGKSTHTKLWLDRFGDRAFMLNDDKPAIRLEDGVWYAYGTPWSGKHDISRNVKVPLAGIAVLERGEANEIAPFGGAEAILALLRQMAMSSMAPKRAKLMQLMNQLITKVPVWKLKCNMDPEAAVVSYEAMSGKKIDD